MRNPHGTSRISPGGMTSGSGTAADKSSPAAWPLIRSGSATSAQPGIRTIFTVIGLVIFCTPTNQGEAMETKRAAWFTRNAAASGKTVCFRDKGSCPSGQQINDGDKLLGRGQGS